MKRCTVAISTLICLTAAVQGELKSDSKSKVVIVKIKEYDESVTHEIMSVEEFRKLETELKTEAKLFPKALELARKEWEKDEQYRHDPFPKSQLQPRRAVAGPVMDEDRAADKLSNIEEQVRIRAQEKAQEEADREKIANKGKNKARVREEAKIKKEEDAQGLRLVGAAIDLVKAKLEQLKIDKPASTAEAAGKAAGAL